MEELVMESIDTWTLAITAVIAFANIAVSIFVVKTYISTNRVNRSILSNQTIELANKIEKGTYAFQEYLNLLKNEYSSAGWDWDNNHDWWYSLMYEIEKNFFICPRNDEIFEASTPLIRELENLEIQLQNKTLNEKLVIQMIGHALIVARNLLDPAHKVRAKMLNKAANNHLYSIHDSLNKRIVKYRNQMGYEAKTKP